MIQDWLFSTKFPSNLYPPLNMSYWMQLRAVDKRRVSRRYGTVSDATLCRVADACKVAIAFVKM
jgi:hypothetical protein